MTYLRNTWYVAAWGEQIRAGELVTRRILGEPIVMFRTEDGGIAAMADVCAHRFAPLHAGKLLPGDRLQCPYHGLQYGPDGICVHNPHGQGRIPASARVRSYPALEKHTLVWIWMGEDAPDPSRIPDFSVLDTASPQLTSKRDWLRMDVDYLLITENLLDLSHVSFLHEGILGNEDTVPAAISVEERGATLWVSRVMSNVRPPGLFDLMFKRDGGRVDHWATMRWDSPGCFLNDAGVTPVNRPREEGTGILGTHFLTPETAETTLYHFAAVRQNPVSWGEAIDTDIRAQMSELRRHAFEDQDKVIIEAQQRALLDPAARTDRPVLLEIDAGPVRFRRILERMLAQEAAMRIASATA
ncbi:aromatic ring-hydroxylating dioxygenase subunit alpha [Reyranella sp. CPCC 100927]|uniref:aromatic ring-hydroxylating dioxygenase subunit alpha n=1 Tax=Reyranella sp. CPCC 100927 TaxID=2599616 RepID=UPI0011B5258B|nr:aromatic ring-hydroxylating dioxygenase subunit alpha [Reyranella sp. CPCC 100927]TWT13896.1 aromatic ring-hydroxylating dioxygenase subunit alpha [Reyranella sp. CPCC 100927]